MLKEQLPFFSTLFMLRFLFISPFSLLLTHIAEVLLWFFTVRMMVLLTVWFDTAAFSKYSLWFSSSGHLMVGKGDPWLMHTQVRISALSTHPEPFKICENPTNTQQLQQTLDKFGVIMNVSVNTFKMSSPSLKQKKSTVCKRHNTLSLRYWHKYMKKHK